MSNARLIALVLAAAPFLAAPRPTLAQSPRAATYITDEEVKAVNATPGIDHTIKVVDIGNENFAVGIIHRGASGGAAATAAAQGISHDSQTEGYLIVSGGGTLVTGGSLVDCRKSAPESAVTKELNGPSCSGPITGADVVKRDVKPGDIIIIPAGVPHGWSDIPDHVDYLSFRPSARVLQAGYVHPAIRKYALASNRSVVLRQNHA